MRTTITKTVSLMLVTVMVLGIVAMPMRAHAGLESLTPATVWLKVVDVTIDIAKEMLNPINNSPNTSAISKFSAFFEPSDTGSHMFVTAEQMNALSSSLLGYGINVQPSIIPGGYWALVLLDNKVGGEAGTITLDANPGDVYVYEGYTVVRLVSPGNDSSDTDSDSAIESNRPSYAPVDPIQPESPPAGGDGNLVVGPSGTIINQNTTTINQNTINNNDYEIKLVDGRTFYYNQQTDTYYIKNYNGDYVECLNINYNPVTQTYHTTTNEWNSTTNNYDQRQYTYQFYYDYTYITYIGSSAEYREAYKVYYELPDGRSSGDLTADELKGISLQFDMVNYDKVETDSLTKILLSFDGSLDNVAFESYSSTGSTSYFIRNSGYSFLESPSPFGGSLFVPISNSAWVNTFVCTGIEQLSRGASFTVQGRFYLDGTWSASNTDPLSKQVCFGVTFANHFVSLFRIYGNTLYSDPIYSPLGGEYSTTVSSGVWYDFAFVYDGSVDKAGLWLNGRACVPDGGSVMASSPDTVAILLSSLQGPSPSWPSSAGSSRFSNMTIDGLSVLNGDSSAPIRVDNLRLVSHPLFSTELITVPQAPFDTNLVYVLPSVSDLNDNTVAIMSQLPVSGYRVGGIRPTDPNLASGYIYMHIDGDFVDSVQQWNGAYWEEVTARLYTGIRWIPVTAFNVFTLEDMFDIIDPDADGSGPGVDSIFQYYLWWSGEWGTFQEWLKGTMQTLIEAIQASGGGGGSTDAPVVIVPGVNDQTTTSEITTENPDGSTTKTTIVSNAAGLVYSNSVTTYPTDVNGNTKTITVYTDSSGVMYQTETIIDKDGNVTVTEPTKATGTLGSILKMITGGVMEIAGTVIEGFVTIVVDGVKFIIEAADGLFDGIGDLFTTMFGAVTDFSDSVQDFVNPPGTNSAVDGDDDEQGDGDGGQAINIFDAFFQVLPDWLVAGVTLCFVMMIVFPLMNKIHF